MTTRDLRESQKETGWWRLNISLWQCNCIAYDVCIYSAVVDNTYDLLILYVSDTHLPFCVYYVLLLLIQWNDDGDDDDNDDDDHDDEDDHDDHNGDDVIVVLAVEGTLKKFDR